MVGSLERMICHSIAHTVVTQDPVAQKWVSANPGLTPMIFYRFNPGLTLPLPQETLRLPVAILIDEGGGVGEKNEGIAISLSFPVSLVLNFLFSSPIIKDLLD